MGNGIKLYVDGFIITFSRFSIIIALISLVFIINCSNPSEKSPELLAINDLSVEEEAEETALLPGEWGFLNRTTQAGFTHEHGWNLEISPAENVYNAMAGGVAAADFDNDGDIDIFMVGGNKFQNRLYQNNGDATFTEVSASWGVNATGRNDSGPAFADFDGDGKLDLVVGGIGDGIAGNTNETLHFYKNNGGNFSDVSNSALPFPGDIDNYSVTFGDYDSDGDLDMFLAHWMRFNPGMTFGDKFLWQNNGSGVFTDVTATMGLTGLQYTFAGTFTQANGDNRPDLLIAGDFGNEKVFINNNSTSYVSNGLSTLTGNNAMGSAIGDFDNDLDLDWFVSHINWPLQNASYDGNRLYQNDGDGTFSDVSVAAGVRNGSWGWGSCFADFNNDGYLDIFHVNGMLVSFSINDKSVMFINNKNGTFTEKSVDLKMNDSGQGRGVSCFDADRDGDIDLFVANNSGPPAFYLNQNGNKGNYIQIKLRGNAPNTEAIGSRIRVYSPSLQQIREIRNGNNYVSQNPAEAHFGLGEDNIVSFIAITWYDGTVSNMSNVAVNQLLTINHP